MSLIIFFNFGYTMKKEKEHRHFANDDPTEFDHKETEDLAKEAIKKFKSLNS